MAAGLQVWDAGGKLVLDLPSRLTIVLGSITVNASGLMVVPDLTKGTPFWIATRTNISIGTFTPFALNVSISGSTLSWSLDSTNETYQLTYGVY